MKGPSPLVPQGSFEAQARGKSHVRIAVFTILAIHVVVIGGLLILGCKREDKTDDTSLVAPTNDLSAVQPFTPETVDPLPPPVDTNVPGTAPGVPTNLAGGTPPPPLNNGAPVQPPVVPPVVPPVAETVPPVQEAMREHTIVRGDTFSGIAAKYGVSVKAIQAANPGIDPTRLQLGKKINIPAKSAPAANTGAPTAAPAAAPDTYVVKSGDSLTKIAKNHGTTVRELQRINGLVTTQIRVGQKLKLPQRPAPAPGAATSSGTAVPAGGLTPPPAQ